MIFPDLCARIVGRTARQHKKSPFKLTAINRSHAAGSIDSIPARFMGIVAKMAALLIRTSIVPKRSRATAAMRRVDSSLETSSWTARASAPVSFMIWPAT